MFYRLAPGNILQLMYLRDRLRNYKPGSFIEIGPGAGDISNLLLSLGWTGTSYDLEPTTIDHLRTRFRQEIKAGRYAPVCEDFLATQDKTSVDLIISAQVIEHLSPTEEKRYFETALQRLTSTGILMLIVPSSKKYWSIEDEIAGHYRRYEPGDIEASIATFPLTVHKFAGRTYPVSNILFPLSVYLVTKHESHKRALTAKEQTMQSGIRSVPFKTTFPKWTSLILNSYCMYPLHLLQKLFSNRKTSLNYFYEIVRK